MLLRHLLVLAVATLMFGCATAPRRSAPGVYYYLRADLYFTPVTFHHEITPQEARKIEKEGGVYYIGKVGQDGLLEEFEKRHARSTFFKRSYEYNAEGKVVRVYNMDSEGKRHIIVDRSPDKSR